MSLTERLYYDDPSARTFAAHVRRVEPRGAATAVWLDRTGFYPTSGGQPFDTGAIGGLRVIGVEEDGDDDVVHLVEGAAALVPGAAVTGVIDWQRRFDHMQQHTAQHALSAVVAQAFGARTVGFHLGADASTIDLDRELTPVQVAEAERQVNAVVWDDRPITIRYATDEEAKALPLRKESVRTGTLRLIEIASLDLSACGGTHVPRTGVIGAVLVSAWERFKGGQRLEFLAGARALSRFQLLRDTTAAAVRRLSVLPQDLPGAIDRLHAEARDLRRDVAGLQETLAGYEAGALAERAETWGAHRVVVQALAGDAAWLKALALGIAARPGHMAILLSDSTPALVVAARAADVDRSCQQLVAALSTAFGGRGGGRAEFAQCGGLQAPPELVVAAVRNFLSRPA